MNFSTEMHKNMQKYIHDLEYQRLVNSDEQRINILCFGPQSAGKDEFIRNIFTLNTENDKDNTNKSNLKLTNEKNSDKDPSKSYVTTSIHPIIDDDINFTICIHTLRNFGASIDSSGDIEMPRKIVESYYLQHLNGEIMSIVNNQKFTEKDHRIHLAIYFSAPNISGLNDLAMHSLKKLNNCAKVVIIAKSDSFTDEEQKIALEKVAKQIDRAKIDCCDIIVNNQLKKSIFASSIRPDLKAKKNDNPYVNKKYSTGYLDFEKSFYENLMKIATNIMPKYYANYRRQLVHDCFKEIDLKLTNSSLSSVINLTKESISVLESQEEENNKKLSEMRMTSKKALDSIRSERREEIQKLISTKQILMDKVSNLNNEENFSDEDTKKKTRTWRKKK